MPSFKRRRVAAVAVVSLLASMLALTALSTDAFAKSSHSRSRAAAAAAASAAPQGAGAGSYYYPPGGDRNIYSRPISGRGVVHDNTAGWGNVGAF